VGEWKERLAARPLAAAARPAAAPEVEDSEEGHRALVVGLEEEAFVAPAGAIVAGCLLRVELLDDQRRRVCQREVVRRLDDDLRCELVR